MENEQKVQQEVKPEVKVEETPKEAKTEVLKPKNLCIGLDCGTMNLCCSRSDSPDVKITRTFNH